MLYVAPDSNRFTKSEHCSVHLSGKAPYQDQLTSRANRCKDAESQTSHETGSGPASEGNNNFSFDSVHSCGSSKSNTESIADTDWCLSPEFLFSSNDTNSQNDENHKASTPENFVFTPKRGEEGLLLPAPPPFTDEAKDESGALRDLTCSTYRMLPRDTRKALAIQHGCKSIGEVEEFMICAKPWYIPMVMWRQG
jgi:hypothetical protein